MLLSVKDSYKTCPRKVEPERTPKRQHISVQFSVFFYSNRFFLIFLLSDKTDLESLMSSEILPQMISPRYCIDFFPEDKRGSTIGPVVKVPLFLKL